VDPAFGAFASRLPREGRVLLVEALLHLVEDALFAFGERHGHPIIGSAPFTEQAF
jgi:hypothetical protein